MRVPVVGMVAVAAAVVVSLGACSGSGQGSAAESPPGTAGTAGPKAESKGAGAEAAPTPQETSPRTPSSLPPGATVGQDDYDYNGELDPVCGTQDFGAGLVLSIPCEIGTANEPDDGVRLTGDSLFRLPGPTGDTGVNLDGISGSLLLGRAVDGQKIVVVMSNSDALFATGSDVIGSTDSLDGTIAVINMHFSGGDVQVRGHTDATGSADSNLALSQRRADTVRQYLTDHGVDASSITAVGLGSTQPLAEEVNPDGSADPAGQQFDRRVEIVVRLAA